MWLTIGQPQSFCSDAPIPPREEGIASVGDLRRFSLMRMVCRLRPAATQAAGYASAASTSKA
jgi:hypothetical protein